MRKKIRKRKKKFNSTFELKSVSIYHKWFFCESVVKILWMKFLEMNKNQFKYYEVVYLSMK